MRLIDNEKFKKEYSEFQEKISKITDENIRKDLTKLLTQLVLSVKNLDQKHTEIVAGMMPSTTSEIRDNILEIRKTIYRKLDECNSAGIVK